jgi:hypothetical protein
VEILEGQCFLPFSVTGDLGTVLYTVAASCKCMQSNGQGPTCSLARTSLSLPFSGGHPRVYVRYGLAKVWHPSRGYTGYGTLEACMPFHTTQQDFWHNDGFCAILCATHRIASMHSIQLVGANRHQGLLTGALFHASDHCHQHPLIHQKSPTVQRYS